MIETLDHAIDALYRNRHLQGSTKCTSNLIGQLETYLSRCEDENHRNRLKLQIPRSVDAVARFLERRTVTPISHHGRHAATEQGKSSDCKKI